MLYNEKIRKAIGALNEQLPTFALVDEGINPGEKLCLLVERGCFWGMGHLPASYPIASSADLKNILNPFADNDIIRNNIFSFAEANPGKRIMLDN